LRYHLGAKSVDGFDQNFGLQREVPVLPIKALVDGIKPLINRVEALVCGILPDNDGLKIGSDQILQQLPKSGGRVGHGTGASSISSGSASALQPALKRPWQPATP
jgi:hypothetical protein